MWYPALPNRVGKGTFVVGALRTICFFAYLVFAAGAVAGDADFDVVVTEDVAISPSDRQWNDWLAHPFQGDEYVWIADVNALQRLLRSKGVSEEVIVEAKAAYRKVFTYSSDYPDSMVRRRPQRTAGLLSLTIELRKRIGTAGLEALYEHMFFRLKQEPALYLKNASRRAIIQTLRRLGVAGENLTYLGSQILRIGPQFYLPLVPATWPYTSDALRPFLNLGRPVGFGCRGNHQDNAPRAIRGFSHRAGYSRTTVLGSTRLA